MDGGFVTLDWKRERAANTDAGRSWPLAGEPIVVRVFALALGCLLVGYMFLGRGFAHIGVGPAYIGDAVLAFGAAVAAFVAIRGRLRLSVTWTVALLAAFVALGALRTLPYLGIHGMASLRDGVLWGYAAFALILWLLADRRWVLSAFRAYGWIVPIFALWLPISWNLFRLYSADIDPSRPGSVVPLVFFKGGDMAVHIVGAVAFLVLGAAASSSGRAFVWRAVIFLPLLWTIFVAGTSNRGSLLTAVVGIVAVWVAAPRSRNWRPFIAAVGLGLVVLLVPAVLSLAGAPEPAGTGTADASQPDRPRASLHANSSPAPPASERVLIPNPGFERRLTGDEAIGGWTPARAEVMVVEGGAREGDQFASVHNPLRAHQATLNSIRFPFESGDDIAVSVWIKALVAHPALEIYINWFDRSGALISSDFLGALTTDGDRRWKKISGALTAPEETTRAQIIFFEATGGATMGLDDVSVESGIFVTEATIPPAPPASDGRPATVQQMMENILSVFGSSEDPGLQGTRQFRLDWWATIVDYTAFGEYFWTGKGFGVNLADDDGFQSTADGSLRAPHNSHMTVLARMGVPGLALWLVLQGAFGLGLLRATLAHRRAGDARLAAIGAWILLYWFAMTVNTSFDPYIEGPQGGIWFWAVFGLGLVFMRWDGRGGKG